MSLHCVRPRLWLGLSLGFALPVLACEHGGDESGGEAGFVCAVDQGPAAQAMAPLPDPCPKIFLWQGSQVAAPLTSGGPLRVELGGQGAHMFALVVVGEGLKLPRDPLDFSDPGAPQLTLHVDVPGVRVVDGHFAQILRYPMRFEETPEGQAFSRYVPVVLLSSEHELRYLHGSPARIELSLATEGHGLGDRGTLNLDRALKYTIDVILDVSI